MILSGIVIFYLPTNLCIFDDLSFLFYSYLCKAVAKNTPLINVVHYNILFRTDSLTEIEKGSRGKFFVIRGYRIPSSRYC